MSSKEKINNILNKHIKTDKKGNVLSVNRKNLIRDIRKLEMDSCTEFHIHMEEGKRKERSIFDFVVSGIMKVPPNVRKIVEARNKKANKRKKLRKLKLTRTKFLEFCKNRK